MIDITPNLEIPSYIDGIQNDDVRSFMNQSEINDWIINHRSIASSKEFKAGYSAGKRTEGKNLDKIIKDFDRLFPSSTKIEKYYFKLGLSIGSESALFKKTQVDINIDPYYKDELKNNDDIIATEVTFSESNDKIADIVKKLTEKGWIHFIPKDFTGVPILAYRAPKSKDDKFYNSIILVDTLDGIALYRPIVYSNGLIAGKDYQEALLDELKGISVTEYHSKITWDNSFETLWKVHQRLR